MEFLPQFGTMAHLSSPVVMDSNYIRTSTPERILDDFSYYNPGQSYCQFKQPGNRMDDLLATLKTEVVEMREQGEALTRQMWELYVTFEDCMAVHHPKHSKGRRRSTGNADIRHPSEERSSAMNCKSPIHKQPPNCQLKQTSRTRVSSASLGSLGAQTRCDVSSARATAGRGVSGCEQTIMPCAVQGFRQFGRRSHTGPDTGRDHSTVGKYNSVSCQIDRDILYTREEDIDGLLSNSGGHQVNSGESKPALYIIQADDFYHEDYRCLPSFNFDSDVIEANTQTPPLVETLNNNNKGSASFGTPKPGSVNCRPYKRRHTRPVAGNCRPFSGLWADSPRLGGSNNRRCRYIQPRSPAKHFRSQSAGGANTPNTQQARRTLTHVRHSMKDIIRDLSPRKEKASADTTHVTLSPSEISPMKASAGEQGSMFKSCSVSDLQTPANTTSMRASDHSVTRNSNTMLDESFSRPTPQSYEQHIRAITRRMVTCGSSMQDISNIADYQGNALRGESHCYMTAKPIDNCPGQGTVDMSEQNSLNWISRCGPSQLCQPNCNCLNDLDIVNKPLDFDVSLHASKETLLSSYPRGLISEDEAGYPYTVDSPLGSGGSISSDSGRASLSTNDNLSDSPYDLGLCRDDSWFTRPGSPDVEREGEEVDTEENIYETIPDEALSQLPLAPLPPVLSESTYLSACNGPMYDSPESLSDNTYASVGSPIKDTEISPLLSSIPPALPARTYLLKPRRIFEQENKPITMCKSKTLQRSQSCEVTSNSRPLAARKPRTSCSASHVGSRRPQRPVHLEDIVRDTDIVDMNSCHMYTVADVLASFERLAGHLPQAEDNVYSRNDTDHLNPQPDLQHEHTGRPNPEITTEQDIHSKSAGRSSSIRYMSTPDLRPSNPRLLRSSSLQAQWRGQLQHQRGTLC